MIYLFEYLMFLILLSSEWWIYNPVVDSGTVVTVSAMFKAEILNFLAKQNLQKGSSSSSPNTLSAFFGPEIILSVEIMLYLVGQSDLMQEEEIFLEIKIFTQHHWCIIIRRSVTFTALQTWLKNKKWKLHSLKILSGITLWNWWSPSLIASSGKAFISHLGHLLSCFCLSSFSNLFFSSSSFLFRSSGVTMPP